MPGVAVACAGPSGPPAASFPRPPTVSAESLLLGPTEIPLSHPSLGLLSRRGAPCRLTPSITCESGAAAGVTGLCPSELPALRVRVWRGVFLGDRCGVRGQGSGGCLRSTEGGVGVWSRSGGLWLSRAPPSTAGYPALVLRRQGFHVQVSFPPHPISQQGGGGGGGTTPEPGSPAPRLSSFDYDLRSDETTR